MRGNYRFNRRSLQAAIGKLLYLRYDTFHWLTHTGQYYLEMPKWEETWSRLHD
jgi:hypothetical protein